ncbi:hypothetical protein AVME950_20540 [Acidovorax sp. SUPP950]|uniref:hypothetical protein n=1 Tax=Acidovorax sp. SUPP950 TaxID=511901 RepID=UPI0023D004C1|nr:hypothetical protein [Acidovorax sp. SUPP950]GKS77326.1 hypothetical protein AVME950_20540 [Acidovorax sp. SUPP950]
MTKITKAQRRLNMLRQPQLLKIYWMLAPVFLAIFIILAFNRSEQSFRVSGMLLQLLGLVCVVRGLIELRREFRMSSLRDGAISWIKCFWSGEPTYVEADGIFTYSSHVDARISTAIPNMVPSANIEDRLARIEAAMRIAAHRLDEAELNMSTEIRRLSELVMHESTDRKYALLEFGGKLQQVSTGGMALSAMGTVWIFIGVVLASVSVELNRWFGR